MKKKKLQTSGFTWRRNNKKLSRNDLCFCGSSLKLKNCDCDKSEFDSYSIFAEGKDRDQFGNLKRGK